MWRRRTTVQVLHRRQPTKAEQLAMMDSDKDRGDACHRWAIEARAQWFQGQRETIEDMLNTRDFRYRYMNDETREMIGRQKWVRSTKAQELADAEQMYTRWAGGYYAAAGVA